MNHFLPYNHFFMLNQLTQDDLDINVLQNWQDHKLQDIVHSLGQFHHCIFGFKKPLFRVHYMLNAS